MVTENGPNRANDQENSEPIEVVPQPFSLGVRHITLTPFCGHEQVKRQDKSVEKERRQED
jgi:hypothetical protein